MNTKYIDAIKKAGVSLWRLTVTENESAELYFIKKKLDIPRIVKTTEIKADIFRDFEKNGQKFRGFTTTYLSEDLSEEEMQRKIQDAYYAASFVANPYFELPDPIKQEPKKSSSNLSGKNLMETASLVADTILEADNDPDGFLNSAEIFIRRKNVSIEDANGLSVGFTSDSVWGEFVTQCMEPENVEQYRQFSYDSLDLDALKERIKNGIRDAVLRANAKETPKAGTYDILLTGENLSSFFSFYGIRSEASVIYPKYSTWKIGDDVQGESEGTRLNITLCPVNPYSEEGIPMTEKVLLKDGKLETIHGATRFCRYLNIPPTGHYEKIKVAPGTVSYEDMKKGNVLETVSFSDFQTDFFDGHFAGEMRLALLHENGTTKNLTGGSINGNIMEAEKTFIFSKEIYKSSDYEGPFAVLIKNVSVAGN